jgi:hypothetical protein
MKVPVQVRLEDGSYPYLKAAMLTNGHVAPAMRSTQAAQ